MSEKPLFYVTMVLFLAGVVEGWQLSSYCFEAGKICKSFVQHQLSFPIEKDNCRSRGAAIRLYCSIHVTVGRDSSAFAFASAFAPVATSDAGDMGLKKRVFAWETD